MSKTDHDQLDGGAELEVFFAAARAEAPAIGPNLAARIMADAQAELAARAAGAQSSLGQGRRRGGFVEALRAAFGGWPALAGMVTATLASVWFGFAAPDQVNTLAGGLLWSDTASSATSGYTLDDLVPAGTDVATLLEETGA
ncbi:MAG TPA: dihydroorotate dehydrogenase [Rhodobacterales bacterium]|nr:dihydroorotate dehydrogenase [Rhodobacterales bacterium]